MSAYIARLAGMGLTFVLEWLERARRQRSVKFAEEIISQRVAMVRSLG